MAISIDTDGWGQRQFTDAQVANLLPVVTRPLFLVQLDHSGSTEYLSCNGAVTFDSQAYSTGGNISRIEDNRRATVWVSATPDRVTEVQLSTWRRQVCKIYYIPALPADGDTFNAADAVLLLDGLINTSRVSGERVIIEVFNKYLTGAMSPGILFNDVGNHIPPSGTPIQLGTTEAQPLEPVSAELTLGGFG